MHKQKSGKKLSYFKHYKKRPDKLQKNYLVNKHHVFEGANYLNPRT